jgi:hypothetical protein
VVSECRRKRAKREGAESSFKVRDKLATAYYAVLASLRSSLSMVRLMKEY